MPVDIQELDLQVDEPASRGASAGGGRPSPLPSPQQALRDAWLAERRAELQARWSAFERDDER